MKKTNLKTIVTMLTLILLAAGCSLPIAGGGSGGDAALQSTYVAQTVIAEITRSALQTAFAGGDATPQVSLTMDAGIATQTLTVTQVPPTATLFIPTFTPTATITNTPIPPVPTSTTVPCNQAKFEADVTIPDNTQLPPGTTFTKTWRLKNIGTCTWTTDYSLVFFNGNSMGGPASVNLGSAVAPGQTVDISVNLVAPSTPGTYTGNWKLRTNTGVTFGLGANASSPFWVTIVVTQPAPTVDPAQPLNFISSYCQATWSSTAVASLACNSTENFSNGSISYSSAPLIEPNYQDDEPTIIVIPANGNNGATSGKYPAVTVQAGDRITGLIGCMANSPNCSVVFKIDYIEGANPVQNLGTWTEVFDGNRTSLNIDLSPLAGKTVQFILTVTNSNNSSVDDRAFWMALRIVR